MPIMDSKQGFKKSSAAKELQHHNTYIKVVFDLNSSQDHNISKIVAWPELKAWKRIKLKHHNTCIKVAVL
jgi:hypothetical protein